ncbi:hypothetical protein DL93DRAFT_2083645 [Clavulina sp. PMI_390]|nr:hypothetical protein DL93DRAFT_2083645 [Clavulina sp. PMI_390]
MVLAFGLVSSTRSLFTSPAVQSKPRSHNEALSICLSTPRQLYRSESCCLISLLEMPNLSSLELIELGRLVLSMAFKQLPGVTSCSVKTLVIACADETTLRDSISLLTLDETWSSGRTPLHFPDIHELALGDTAPERPRKGLINFKLLKALANNRGGTGESPRIDDKRLTADEELSLLAVGALSEITYDFTVDDHGVPVEFPRYSQD